MPNGPFLYADQLLDVLTAKSEQGGFRSAPLLLLKGVMLCSKVADQATHCIIT